MYEATHAGNTYTYGCNEKSMQWTYDEDRKYTRQDGGVTGHLAAEQDLSVLVLMFQESDHTGLSALMRSHSSLLTSALKVA
jgi:hypothetical protein